MIHMNCDPRVVNVTNRRLAQQIHPYNPANVISISRPGEPANLHPDWNEILRLEFHDVVEPKREPGLVPFDPAWIPNILDFIHKSRDFGLLVHCDGGISRSVAIGWVAADILKRKLVLWNTTDTGFANSLITRSFNRYFLENPDAEMRS